MPHPTLRLATNVGRLDRLELHSLQTARGAFAVLLHLRRPTGGSPWILVTPRTLYMPTGGTWNHLPAFIRAVAEIRYEILAGMRKERAPAPVRPIGRSAP